MKLSKEERIITPRYYGVKKGRRDGRTCSKRGGRRKPEMRRPLRRSVRRGSSREGVATWW
jgi:hypothetical protein